METEEILEAFEFLSDWEDRYELINDLGKQLPLVADEEKTDENLIRGCETRTWLTGHLEGAPPVLQYRADAEGPLVRGLVALLLVPFQGKSPTEILGTDPGGFVGALGLEQHLSPSRRVGMHAFLDRVRAIARSFDR